MKCEYCNKKAKAWYQGKDVCKDCFANLRRTKRLLAIQLQHKNKSMELKKC